MAANGFSSLRHRNFACYLSARVLTTLAVQMQSVAIGWQVYSMTGSVFDLGLIGLAQFAPFLALILVAGHVADRFDRRIIILLCFGVQLLCGFLLLGYSIAGPSVVWPVFAILVLFGCARAFTMPATQAILINMVPPEDFPGAVALSSSASQVAYIAGPALGGLLYLAGPNTVYGVAAALLVLAILLMWGAKSFGQLRNRDPVTWHSISEGLRFVWSKPTVLGAISLDMFAVLLGGATALLPAIAQDILHVGPAGLGMLRAAPAAGAAVISFALAFRPITRAVGVWMFAGVALFGASTVVLGLSTSLWVSLIALFMMGVGDMVSVFIRRLLVQYETPDAIRGRVSAVNSVFVGASNELGEFESGLMAGWLGLVPALVVGGVATLGVTVVWCVIFPVLRKMDRFPEPVRNEKISGWDNDPTGGVEQGQAASRPQHDEAGKPG